MGCDVKKWHSQSEMSAVCIHHLTQPGMRLIKLQKLRAAMSGREVHHVLSKALNKAMLPEGLGWHKNLAGLVHKLFLPCCFLFLSREWVNVWNQAREWVTSKAVLLDIGPSDPANTFLKSDQVWMSVLFTYHQSPHHFFLPPPNIYGNGESFEQVIHSYQGLLVFVRVERSEQRQHSLGECVSTVWDSSQRRTLLRTFAGWCKSQDWIRLQLKM